jgi:hypothetical protein
MTTLDFSDFENADLIPAGTDCILQMKVKYGEATDGVLSFTKNRDAEVLKAECTVVDGPHARRKLWLDLLVTGSTDGQKMMADKNKALLKSIIDSARDLDPNDKSPAARQARTVQWRDFDGLRFQAIIGVQPARADKDTGQTYQARNVLDKVITRDMTGWRGPIQQVAFDDVPFGHAPAANGPAPAAEAAAAAAPHATAPIARPSWAK